MGRSKGKGTLQLEKTGIWTIRATINGSRVSKSTGTRDRAEAEKALDDFMSMYVRGDDLRSYNNVMAAVATKEQRAEMEKDKLPQMTLDQAWAAYMESPLRRDLAASTIKTKEIAWYQFVKWMHKWYAKVTEVRGVTTEHTARFVKFLKEEQKCAASTFNGRICLLREVYRVLMKVARARVNPFEGIRLMNDDSHCRRELTIEELERLIEAAKRVGEEWSRLFALGMYTGLRLGDCSTLNWGEVDLVRSIIQRIPEKTKRYAHGKPVTIPVHPVLAEVLGTTPKDQRMGFVLPTIARYYKQSRPKVSYQLKRIFESAGIVTSVTVEGRTHKAPEATFHSLRHTFVSMSANAGVPLHIVQSIVGHESTAMTRHYYHESLPALQRAISAIPAIGETKEYGILPSEPVLDAIPVSTPEPVALPAPVAATTSAPVAAATTEPVVAEEPRPAPVLAFEPKVAEERIGGRVAKPRPPKTDWIASCIRRYGKRVGKGILETTTDLIGNGGYKFLQGLWDKGVSMEVGEALEAMTAYLAAK